MANKINKKTVVKLPAKVLIGKECFNSSEISLRENFVRFAFQSVGGGVEVGPNIFVFDHRKQVVNYIQNSGSNLDFQQAKEFLEIVNTLAKVVVMKKTVRDVEFEYINLFNFSSKEKVSGLFSITMYAEKHNASFSIEEDNALFSFKSYSSSKTGMHGEMIFLALTDEKHQSVIYKDGYANVGHGGPRILHLGRDYEESLCCVCTVEV